MSAELGRTKPAPETLNPLGQRRMLRRVVPSTEVKLEWSMVQPPPRKHFRAKAITSGEAKVVDLSFEGAFLATARADLVVVKTKLRLTHEGSGCFAIVRRVIDGAQMSAWGVTFHEISPALWTFLQETVARGYLIPETPIS